MPPQQDAGHKQIGMNTVYLKNDMLPMQPCVATIGFFDGVHRGHQYLIRQVTDEARAAGLQSTVITFDRHPRQVLNSDYIPQLLSTPESKLLLLSKTGVDNAVVLPFDREMAAMSAQDFMNNVLKDKLNVRKLIIGYDNHFGHNRSEGFGDYVRYGREAGIEVIQANAFTLCGYNVSSSVIRRFLQDGEVEMAERCLGYPYTISGIVKKGFQQGRKLGFPTANLDPSTVVQMIPAYGAYAVTARIEQSLAMRPAMMNIGTRPTFGGNEVSLETNIFNFSENIYGKLMLVSFIHRIRGEQKFDNEEQLQEQLCMDKKMVEQQFNKDKEE